MSYELRGKQVLITGATGFIGNGVALRLLQSGAHVRALVRDAAKADNLLQNGAEVVVGKMTDPSALRQAVQGCQVVFHFAGVLTENQPYTYYQQVNVEGTRTLAEAALEFGVERFIHTSTVYVYGMDATGVINESSPRIPSSNPYADTKLEAESVIRQLITSRGLPALIVQPSQVYGPGDKTWTLRPIELIRSGRMILVDGGKGLVQPIYIDDLVEGILAVARQGQTGEAYILCGAQVMNVRQFFGYFAKILHRKNIPAVPGWLGLAFVFLAELAGKLFKRSPVFTSQELRNTMLRSSSDGRKAEAQLGFKPKITMDEGMRQVEEWIQHSEGSMRARAD